MNIITGSGSENPSILTIQIESGGRTYSVNVNLRTNSASMRQQDRYMEQPIF